MTVSQRRLGKVGKCSVFASLYFLRFASPGHSVATSWKVFQYFWTILKALIAIVVAVGCFSAAEGKFQTVVVCLLVAIYAQVVTSYMLWSRLKTIEAVSVSEEFVRVRRLLKDQDTENETSSAAEGVKSLKGSQGHFYINWLAYGVIYLIVLWKLFVVVLGF